MNTAPKTVLTREEYPQQNPGYLDSDMPLSTSAYLEEAQTLLGRAGLHNPVISEAFTSLSVAVEAGKNHGFNQVRQRAAEIVTEDREGMKSRAEEKMLAGSREFYIPERTVNRVKTALLASYGLKEEDAHNIRIAKGLDDLSSTIRGVIRGQSIRFGDKAKEDIDSIGTFRINARNGFSDDALSQHVGSEFEQSAGVVLRNLITKLQDKEKPGGDEQPAKQAKAKGLGRRALGSLGIQVRDKRLRAIEETTDEIIGLYEDLSASDVDKIAREMLIAGGYESSVRMNAWAISIITDTFKNRMGSSYLVIKSVKQLAEIPQLKSMFSRFEDMILSNGGSKQRLGLENIDDSLLQTVLDAYDSEVERSSSQRLALQRLNRRFHTDKGGLEENYKVIAQIFPNNKPPLLK